MQFWLPASHSSSQRRGCASRECASRECSQQLPLTLRVPACQPASLPACQPASLPASRLTARTPHPRSPVGRRLLVAIPTLIGPTAFLGSAARAAVEEDYRKGEVYHTPGEWKKILGDDMAYRVLRQESTERPVSEQLPGSCRCWARACAPPVWHSHRHECQAAGCSRRAGTGGLACAVGGSRGWAGGRAPGIPAGPTTPARAGAATPRAAAADGVPCRAAPP